MSSGATGWEARRALTPEGMQEVMDELGLSQNDVALRLGVGQSTVSEWLSSKRRPPELVAATFVDPVLRGHILEQAALLGGRRSG